MNTPLVTPSSDRGFSKNAGQLAAVGVLAGVALPHVHAAGSDQVSVALCKISIDERGVTLKMPSLFSGEEKTIPFSRISSVDVVCPFIGYSDIKINTTGEGAIIAHGFSKAEVMEMKEVILEKIHKLGN